MSDARAVAPTAQPPYEPKTGAPPTELHARIYVHAGAAASEAAHAILFDGCRVTLRFDDAPHGQPAEYAAELVLEDWPYVLAGQDATAVFANLDPSRAKGAVRPNASFVLLEGGRPIAGGTVTEICQRRAAGS